MPDQFKSRLLQYAMLGFALAVGAIVLMQILGWGVADSLRPFMAPLSIACMGCGMGAGAIERRRK